MRGRKKERGGIANIEDIKGRNEGTAEERKGINSAPKERQNP